MAGSMRISIFESKEMQAAALAIRAANREVRRDIRRFTQAEVSPDWRGQLAERAQTHLSQVVLVNTARVKVSDQNVALQSAMIGRALSKGSYGHRGAKPADIARAVEFGANRDSTTTYTRYNRRTGKPSQVTRRTKAQFQPTRRQGYVVWPAAAQMIPRYASLWVQTCMRTIYDAIDQKKSG